MTPAEDREAEHFLRLLTSLRGTVEIVQAQEDVLTELMAARGIVPPERPALSVLPGGKAEGP
jgi:hypothetical protein